MTRRLTLGYSPCPNDTFIFHALVHGLVPLPDFTVNELLEDVETLNRLATGAALDVTKVSCHALGHLRESYCLLRSGAALGRGCGPLVVATTATTMAALRGGSIAIPGTLTTANLLLQLFGAGYENVVPMPFDRIMPALAGGDVEAGVIIHESRFTYRAAGLHAVQDLGAWWEETTGLPIPLGCILARRDLGAGTIRAVDTAIRASLEHARAHPDSARAYIRAHAQELDEAVTAAHIDLYVNDFSLDLGTEGIHSIETLLARAEARGLFPACDLPLLVP
jgi:1,4-dihydroxy-6-naphthoate synthase